MIGREPGDVRHHSSFKVSFGEVFTSWWGPPVDPTTEIEKREKELAQVVKRIASKEKKLSNDAFVSRAPAEVVQRERDSLKELKDRHMAIMEV